VRLFTDVPTRVLALYAHPDDADIACGGTLATWAARGAHVVLVTVCDGAKGTRDPQRDSRELADVRHHELTVAASQLGVAEVLSLGRADGEALNDDALRRDIVALVRRIRPDVVLGPDPTATFFGSVYVNHRDHRETGWAVLDAVAPAAAMPLYFPDAGEPHEVSTVLLSGTHEADVVVNIADALDAKCKAVLAHTSQISGDHLDVRDVVEDRAAETGRLVSVAAGEAFRELRLFG
jgi:LmbE family N-acetylglucosaminyl deacetylase